MNESQNSFSIAGRLRSGRHAAQGIIDLLRTQHNAWVHALATVCVITLGVLFRVTALEWCVLVLAMIAVWAAESFNTALEFLCDLVSPEYHPLVKKAKDIAAAGVLLSSIGAAAVGFIVLLPYLLEWL